MENNGMAVKSVVATKAKPTEIQNAINRLYEDYKKSVEWYPFK